MARVMGRRGGGRAAGPGGCPRGWGPTGPAAASPGSEPPTPWVPPTPGQEGRHSDLPDLPRPAPCICSEPGALQGALGWCPPRRHRCLSWRLDVTSVPRGALATSFSMSHCLQLTLRLTPGGGRGSEERNTNWAKGNIQTFAPQALLLQPRKAGRETLSPQPGAPLPGRAAGKQAPLGSPHAGPLPARRAPRVTRDAPPEVWLKPLAGDFW